MVNYFRTLRLLQLIVLFTAGILVVVGQGVCTFPYIFNRQDTPQCYSYRYSLNTWHIPGGWVAGQFGVIIVHVILLICVYIHFRRPLGPKDDVPHWGYTIGNIVSMFLGSCEAFMAATAHGFYVRAKNREDEPIGNTYELTTTAAPTTQDRDLIFTYSYVESWVAASILYYVFFVLNAIDCASEETADQQQPDAVAMKKSMSDGDSKKVTIKMPDRSAEPFSKKENVTITMAAEPVLKKVQLESGHDSVKSTSGGIWKKLTIKTADQSAKQNRIDSRDMKNVSIKSEGSSKKAVAKADQIVVPLLKQSV